jgi:hypothetical protein
VDTTGQFVVLAAGKYVFRSSDFGETWGQIPANNDTDIIWNSVSSDGAGDRLLISGVTPSNECVVYYSADAGYSWSRISHGLHEGPYLEIYETTISADGNMRMVASFPIISYPYEDDTLNSKRGNVYLSSDPYLFRQGLIQPNTTAGSYTFTDLGYIFDTFYMSLMLQSSAFAISTTPRLVVTTGSSSSNPDERNIVLYDGVCAPKSACSDSNNEFVYCENNIQLNRSFLPSQDNESMFTVNAIIYPGDGTASAPCIEGAVGDDHGSLFYFSLVVTVSVPATDPGAGNNSQLVNFDLILPWLLLTLMPFTFLVVCCWITRRSAGTNVIPLTLKSLLKGSMLWTVWDFFFVGVQLPTEFWLYGVLYTCNIENLSHFKLLSGILVFLRLLRCLPAAFLLWKLWVSDSRAHKSAYKDHKLPMLALSALTVFDCQFIRYVPRATSKSSQTTVDDVDVEKALQYHGYHDKSTMDLSTMCGLIFASTVLVASMFCVTETKLHHFHNTTIMNIVCIYLATAVIEWIKCVSVMVAMQLQRLQMVNNIFERTHIIQRASAVRKTIGSKCEHWSRGKGLLVPYTLLLYLVKFILVLTAYILLSRWSCYVSPFVADKQGGRKQFIDFVVGSVIGYGLALIICVYGCICYPDFDSHAELSEIAKTFTLDAEKITKLLQLTTVVLSTIDVIGLVATLSFSYQLNMVYGKSLQEGCPVTAFAEASVSSLFLVVGMLELLTPVIVAAVQELRNPESCSRSVILVIIRLDIWLSCWFLKLMLSWVFPLSLLSTASSFRAKALAHQEITDDEDAAVARGQRERLSFQLRDNWRDTQPISASDGSVWMSPVVSFFRLLDRLSKRFTVVYSFLKLCGTIGFTLFINSSYLYCQHPGVYHQSAVCGVRYYDLDFDDDGVGRTHPCASNCAAEAFPSIITYPSQPESNCPPLPPTAWECTVQVSGECLCNNWFIFQFTVILLHAVHYVVQCYFYIRYDYFDPQQNQINCVETYTFAGENLTLFLTHPSMCFLSILEAACITIVWADVMLASNAYCIGDVNGANWDRLPFAMFITFIEVYKANMSTCLKLVKQYEYWWAFWSLIRLDLFVFYGFTLFLQTFFFPFSLVGYSMIAQKGRRNYVSVPADDGDDLKGGCEDNGAVVGYIPSLEEELLTKRDSSFAVIKPVREDAEVVPLGEEGVQEGASTGV